MIKSNITGSYRQDIKKKCLAGVFGWKRHACINSDDSDWVWMEVCVVTPATTPNSGVTVYACALLQRGV